MFGAGLHILKGLSKKNEGKGEVFTSTRENKKDKKGNEVRVRLWSHVRDSGKLKQLGGKSFCQKKKKGRPGTSLSLRLRTRQQRRAANSQRRVARSMQRGDGEKLKSQWGGRRIGYFNNIEGRETQRDPGGISIKRGKDGIPSA